MELTAERLRQLLRYDPETGLFTRRKNGKPTGSPGWKGYINISLDGRIYRGHRLAWLYVHGNWPEPQADHENLDKADNRIANLREASPSQQKLNAGLRRDNTSGFKGVRRNGRRWEAVVWEKNKCVWRKTFPTPEAAHNARIAAATAIYDPAFFRPGQCTATTLTEPAITPPASS